MENYIYIALLYDFYGSLLTSYQQKVFNMYYFQDLSLQEICEKNLVSRQAVSDLLNRTVKNLENYEEKLSLIDTHKNKMKKVDRLLENVTAMEAINTSEKMGKSIDIIKSTLYDWKNS